MIYLSTKSIITQLLKSKEPVIRLKTYLRLIELDYNSSEIKKITTNIKESSPLISNFFSYLPKDETSKTYHVYTKFQGAHWLISILADIGYPKGDKILQSSINRVLKWLLGGKKRLIIDGRRRFCASQEGNGLYSALQLGFYDERCDALAERLIHYQWPDGGWNCDRNPTAINSSYHESLIPYRALYHYLKVKNNSEVQNAVDKAAELFLKRKLFKRFSDGSVINKKWLLLHYPPYWHYDILMALKVLAEANKIHDKRCSDALDLLESKQLENGGFPREDKYCQSSNSDGRYFNPGDWKPAHKNKMNEWVTIDALYILKKANRIDIDF